jgi:hypothetical protein
MIKKRNQAQTAEGGQKMGGHRKLFWIGLAAVGIIVVGLGVYYLLDERRAKEPFLTSKTDEKQISPTPGDKAMPPKEGPFIILPALNDSDEWVRQKAKSLSPYAKLAEWLRIDDLIRRITAALDNIAEGKSPRKQLKFLDPKKPFTIIKKQERIFLNPQSYRRYDLVADAFSSLNAGGVVRLFLELKPLFQEAYKELGYPNQDFQNTLIRAIRELLDTPIVEGDIELEEGVASYYMADEDLEELSDAQQHLLRMGPQNIRKIQKKLREIAVALGVSENQLPKSKGYPK